MAGQIVIRERLPRDADWSEGVLVEAWGSGRIVTRGRLHDANRQPALVAESAGRPAGLLTYRTEGAECELLTLNSILKRRGVASALIECLVVVARDAACRRIWLVTSNDNTPALRFYQRRGFRLVAIHRGAIAAARALKPGIPAVGIDGIPLCDEIELELLI